jgi:endonuclease/exonuclease/phosphatase family metal-dependent hydrolase
MHSKLLALLGLGLCIALAGGCAGDDDTDDDASDDDDADDDASDDDGADDDAGDDDTGDDDTGDDDTDEPWPPYALLSLNLHCLLLDGTTFADNQTRLEAIAALAAAEDVRAIALQEVCTSASESAPEILSAALEVATGEPWSLELAFAHVAWQGTPDEADEYVGLMVRGTLAEPVSTSYHVQAPLTRVEQSGTLPPELGGFRLTSVHLEVTDPATRAAQARQSAARALVATDPGFETLIAGDCNDVAGSVTHGAFLAMGFQALSDGLDAGSIDHIFAHRGANLELLEARLVFDGSDGPVVSDHPGVLVRVGPAAGQPTAATRFAIAHDPGPGHYLALRGDAAPLSWQAGWPAVEATIGSWTAVFTELAAGPFEYKVLLDDQTWQTGDDELGEGQTDHTCTPAF